MDYSERKRTRLKGYDYCEPGAYFVTVCTRKRKQILNLECENIGNALCGVPYAPNFIVHRYIKEIENRFDNMKIAKYVVMPNHLHLIIIITERHAGRSLHDAIRWLKTMVTNCYIKGVKSGQFDSFDQKIWQKSFHDHIIRNEDEYWKIWEYIDTNPLCWESDCFYDG